MKLSGGTGYQEQPRLDGDLHDSAGQERDYYYNSVQSAITAAASGATIRVQAIDLPDTGLSINKALTIDGGYLCDYSKNPSTSVIKGNGTITDGTFSVTVGGVTVD